MKIKSLPSLGLVATYLITAVAFLIPVFFLPLTSEYFEYNKLTLFFVTALIFTVGWAIRMLVEKKVEITKSPINLTLVLLVAVYAVSTYFSLNKASSIYGSFGRWGNSLALISTGVLFYFAVTANIKSKDSVKMILTALLGGITISSIVAILAFFGVKFSGADFAQIRNFTLTGSPMIAASIAAVGALLATGRYLEQKDKVLGYVFLGAAVVNVLAVALIGLLAPWGLLAAGMVSFFLFVPSEILAPYKVKLGSLFAITILLGVLFSVPALRGVLNLPADYQRDLQLDLRSSWIITASTLRDFPLFGSGPSTFYLDFSHYRPLVLNGSDLWGIRFDVPFNEFLNIAATLGVVGALIYFMFWTRVLKLIKFAGHSATSLTLRGVLMGLFVFALLSHFSVLMTFVLFLVLALMVIYIRSESTGAGVLAQNVVETAVISFSVSGSSATVTTRAISVLFALPLLAVSVAGGYFGAKAYGAEVMMRKSIRAANQNKAGDLFNAQRQAIRLNPYINAYHASFANTNFTLANALARNKKPEDLTDEDKKNIQNLVTATIQELRVTTELLDPTNPGNWQQRARTYSLLTGVAKDAGNWAVSAYTRAIELDPTNPKLRLDLGGLFFAAKNFDIAERHFRSAVALKPDYANAHYNLASALLQSKKYQDAISEMEIVLRLVPKDSEDFKRATTELNALKDLPEVKGALSTQPSVTDLQNSTTKPTTQEPLKPATPDVVEATKSANPQ